MSRCRNLSALCLLFIMCAVPGGGAAAQPHRPAQSGEIKLHEAEKTVSTPEAVTAYFTELLAQLDKLAAGQISKAAQLKEKQVLYVNAVYLFCSIRRGVCPWMLDAVLEPDIINSRIDKNADCPTMHAFWKTWVANDLQHKHEYQVQTGFLRDTMQFQKQGLPRYLACKDTVAKEIEGAAAAKSDADFFKQRYGAADSPQKKAVRDMVAFLEALKVKQVDVFGSTGIVVAGSGSAQGQKGSTSKKKKK